MEVSHYYYYRSENLERLVHLPIGYRKKDDEGDCC